MFIVHLLGLQLNMLLILSPLTLQQPSGKYCIFQVRHQDSEELSVSCHTEEEMAEPEFKPGSFVPQHAQSFLPHCAAICAPVSLASGNSVYKVPAYVLASAQAVGSYSTVTLKS